MSTEFIQDLFLEDLIENELSNPRREISKNKDNFKINITENYNKFYFNIREKYEKYIIDLSFHKIILKNFIYESYIFNSNIKSLLFNDCNFQANIIKTYNNYTFVFNNNILNLNYFHINYISKNNSG
jgi:hypothetical protein